MLCLSQKHTFFSLNKTYLYKIHNTIFFLYICISTPKFDKINLYLILEIRRKKLSDVMSVTNEINLRILLRGKDWIYLEIYNLISGNVCYKLSYTFGLLFLFLTFLPILFVGITWKFMEEYIGCFSWGTLRHWTEFSWTFTESWLPCYTHSKIVHKLVFYFKRKKEK